MRLVVLLVSFLSLVCSPALAQAASPRPLVAVIDSGIARTTELAPALVAEFDFGSDVPRPSFKPRYDHGTMVATILVRAVHRPVDIVSLRIDDPAGCAVGRAPPCQLSWERIAAAIRKAGDLGATVINISLALEDHPGIVQAVREAAAKGSLIVMAAGNDGLDHPGNLRMAKAAYPRAVLVGALDGKGRAWAGTNRPDATASGYHYAWQFGVAVPTVGANGSKIFGTGTSFAAPLESARVLDSGGRASAAGCSSAPAQSVTPKSAPCPDRRKLRRA